PAGRPRQAWTGGARQWRRRPGATADSPGATLLARSARGECGSVRGGPSKCADDVLVVEHPEVELFGRGQNLLERSLRAGRAASFEGALPGALDRERSDDAALCAERALAKVDRRRL